jgi:hypothetical protein
MRYVKGWRENGLPPTNNMLTLAFAIFPHYIGELEFG